MACSPRFRRASILRTPLVVALLAAASVPFCCDDAMAELRELDDAVLGNITGQALFTSAKLAGEATAGNSDLTFYRLMMDADVAMNTNIDKLQMGCGGSNETIAANACDMDLDYVRFMGRGAGQPGANGAAPAPGAGSDFLMQRPFVEFAVRNDGTASSREVVGWRIGAQNIAGFISIGQFTDPSTTAYAPGCTNTNGAISLGCHPAGINRFSGYMRGRVQGEAYGCDYFIFPVCTPNPDPAQQKKLGDFDETKDIVGTRIKNIMLSGVTINSYLGIPLTGNINENARFVHGFDINNTANFFIGFQRDNNIKYPSFTPGTGHSSTLGSNYMYPANRGWWMNVPYAEMTGLKSYGNVVNTATALFLTFTDVDMGQRPAQNCYGTAAFC